MGYLIKIKKVKEYNKIHKENLPNSIYRVENVDYRKIIDMRELIYQIGSFFENSNYEIVNVDVMISNNSYDIKGNLESLTVYYLIKIKLNKLNCFILFQTNNITNNHSIIHVSEKKKEYFSPIFNIYYFDKKKFIKRIEFEIQIGSLDFNYRVFNGIGYSRLSTRKIFEKYKGRFIIEKNYNKYDPDYIKWEKNNKTFKSWEDYLSRVRVK